MGGSGVFLERLTWDEAAPLLAGDPMVVLPVGAAAKEHGPHLPLGTDRLLADYLAARLAERVDAVILPTLTYGYYPAFTEYPGSTTLRAATFGRVVRDVLLSVHRHGPRRFLILNTGISTTPVLEVVARDLNRLRGLLVGVTRIEDLGRPALDGLLAQTAGSHADEHETSLMLAIAPDAVRADRLVRETGDHPRVPGLVAPEAFHRGPGRGHSKTGVYGDATLATRDKGERILAALLPALVHAAEYVRTAPLA